VTKKSNILNIVKEDILRILAEKKKKVPLNSIKAEVKVSSFFMSNALKELERKRLIRTEGNYIKLTKIGQEKSKDILRKHLILEKYFKKARNKKKAHKIAHILEHYISEEVIRNIKKISTFKEKGVPLTEFKQKNGLITDIILDNGLFERIISMGIFPGEKIKIINGIPNAVVIKVKNKKFVLDKNIAKEIKVLEYENS
jgi:Mn-dependent DtxR family transcriptional regulator